MQAPARLDSPEDCAKNFSACGGEIRRLVKPTACAKSEQTPG